jgi:hypothetical protein
VDAWGNTSVAGVQIAGDNGGIVGAQAAALSGQLAAIDAARNLGRITETERDRLALPLSSQLNGHLRARPFLDVLYRPPQEMVAPREPGTIVCRC